MPKQKTKKSLTRRFKITKNGKVLRMQSFAGHLNVKKSKKRKRRLKGTVATKEYHAKKIRKYLGKQLSTKPTSKIQKKDK